MGYRIQSVSPTTCGNEIHDDDDESLSSSSIYHPAFLIMNVESSVLVNAKFHSGNEHSGVIFFFSYPAKDYIV